MGLLDGPLRQVASLLVGKFGTHGTFRRVSTGVFQPGTDTVANTAVDYLNIPCSVVDYTINEVRGGVQAGDRKVLVAAADLEVAPTAEWQFLLGARTYRVIDVRITMSGDYAALYECQVRGAP